jgi:hypothetical protein
MQICIYCASSSKIHQDYFKATQRLAEVLAKEKIKVVFGGGSEGLMGHLADNILKLGGDIKGIMPRFMNEVEWAHRDLQELDFVDTMHERKAKFLEGTDAVVALAGGTGTLEELLEAITLKRLGQFSKPIIILNTRNYYQPLKALLERSIEEGFMHPRHGSLWTFVDRPEEVLPAIRQAPPWPANRLDLAKNK